MWAVVTGANRGIGREVAASLSKTYNVIVACRRADSAAETAEALRAAGGLATPLQLDVGDSASVGAAVESVTKLVGDDRLTVLVNNAGGSYVPDWDEATYSTALRANFAGAVDLTLGLLPALVDGGRVVMVSSGLGMYNEQTPETAATIEAATTLDALRVAVPFSAKRPPGGAPAYNLSKCLLNRATRLLAADPAFTARRVAVSACCPGWVRTDMGGASATRSVEEGAASVLWLATHDDMPSGVFVRDGKTLAW